MSKGASFFTIYFYYLQLLLIQGQRTAGRITQVGHACNMVNSQMVTPNHFTSQMTILPCLNGLKGWNRSSESVICDQLRGSLCSAQIFAAPLVVLTATISGSFFHSQILSTTGLNFKNLSRPMAISAISIRNTIVNWTSSNNTGVW